MLTKGTLKVGILAGGYGTRLAEESEFKPKVLVEIGGKPILWHIMKHYHHYGFKDFVIALGHKGDDVRRYFEEHYPTRTNSKEGLEGGHPSPNDRRREDWRVKLVDTGNGTETGGRIKRLAQHLGEGTFMLTWGDGVSNVNLKKLLDFHHYHGRLATVTAVRPPTRFGRLDLEGDVVVKFTEKPKSEKLWINGAFFVLEPGVFDYIEGDDSRWEHEPLERLAEEGQLMAFRHESFWQCMDTVHDQRLLQKLWDEGDPPWRVWD